MKESTLFKQCMLAVSAIGARLFRNNVAMAWVGNGAPKMFRSAQMIRVEPGDIVLRGGRPLHAGLHRGSGDGIGWQTEIITPEMVGQRVAVFVSIETKTGRNKATDEQQNWIDQVNAAGGRAGVARTPEEAQAIAEGKA